MPTKGSNPPQFKGNWLSGHVKEYRGDRLAFLLRCFREHGECVGFRLGTRRIVLLSDHKLIKQVLVYQNENFTKSPLLSRNRRVFGEGLLTAEGSHWFHHRRLLQAAFLPDRIEAYAPMMVAFARRLINTWRDGETRDLHADMMRLTLEVVAKSLFDANISRDMDEVAAATTTILNGMIARLSGIFIVPEWLPTPTNLRIRDAVRRLEAIVSRIIREREQCGLDRPDVLSILLSAG